MLKLIVCFSLLITTFVAANYDFQDADFNELLFKDLTAAAAASETEDKPLRFRRGSDNESTGCQRKKAKEEKDYHCCSGEKGSPEALEAAKEVKKQCFAEIRGESGSADDDLTYDPLSCEGVQVMREKTVCAAECIAKKLDLLDDKGEFMRDALLNHTRKLIGESKWKAAVMEEYVGGCLDELKTKKQDEKKQSSDQVQASCNASPLEYHHCIWKKFVEGCPVESQIDSKKCRKIRERLAKGDTSYAGKTFKKLFKH